MAANSATQATSNDFDDMNATPLGKLPMPIMQSKADAPRVDPGVSVSYADILRTMGTDQTATPVQQAQPAVQQPVQQQAPPPLQQALQPALQQQFPGATMLQPPQAQHMAVSMDDRYYARPQPRAAVKRRRWEPARARAPLSKWLGAYKNAVIVLAIVFAVTLVVAPRLAATFPVLARPGMRLTPPGLALVALLCGGIYRVAEHAL